MAKTKTKVNKAAEIRNYFAANPNAKGGDVVAALKAKGITVSLPQVYNAKQSKKANGKTVKKAGRMKVRPEDLQNVGNKSLTVLEAAFTLLEHMTVDTAKSILDRLSGGKKKAK